MAVSDDDGTNSVAGIIQSRVATLSRQLSTYCGSPRRLLDILSEGSLIPCYLEAVDKIDVHGVSDYDKVSRLLSCVIVQVDTSSEPVEVLLQFLHSIEAVDPSMVDVTKEMHQKLKEYCSHTEREVQLKNADSSLLKKKEFSSLEAINKLRFEYARFIIKLKGMLKRKRVALSDLKLMLCSTSEQQQSHPAMRSNTIDKFMEVACNDGQLPALQYQYLEKIAVEFLKESGKQLISEYEDKIKQCLQNQVSLGVKKLTVKVNVGFHQHVPLTDKSSAYQITKTLAKVFQFNPEEVKLVLARKGCIELLYIVPMTVSSAISSWDRNQRCHLLRESNIINISIDGTNIWNQKTEQLDSQDQKEVAVDMPELSAKPSKSLLSKKFSSHHALPLGEVGLMRGMHSPNKERKRPRIECGAIVMILAVVALTLLSYAIYLTGLVGWRVGVVISILVLCAILFRFTCRHRLLQKLQLL